MSKEKLGFYNDELAKYKQVLEQHKYDKNKIYSLHKSFTSCIAKGKAHKEYEFGNKIGLVVNPKSLVILGIESFEGNPHDSKTIEPLLNQIKKNFDYQPEEVVYDRAGKGQKQINGVNIVTPTKPYKKDSSYQKQLKRKKFRRRAAIEPIIGHLKTDFRMEQNYLSGNKSPRINALLAATGWNLKKLMVKLKKEYKNFFDLILLQISYLNLKLKFLYY